LKTVHSVPRLVKANDASKWSISDALDADMLALQYNKQRQTTAF
jgi:hypothetical protein